MRARIDLGRLVGKFDETGPHFALGVPRICWEWLHVYKKKLNACGSFHNSIVPRAALNLHF